MKFGQLRNFNMANTFFENHTQNGVKKQVADKKKKKMSISFDH